MAAVSSAVSRCFFSTNQIAAAATTNMTRIGPRRELFSGGVDEGAFERRRASAFAAARASGVSLRVCASGLLARETRGSSGGGRGVTEGWSRFGSTGFSAGFSAGGGAEPEAGVALAGSLGVAFCSMTGAAMPMRVRLPGGTALAVGVAVAAGGRLVVVSPAGVLLGFWAGLSLGLSLGLSVTTEGAGMPMRVPPRAAEPSGRVGLVSRELPSNAGLLGDRAGPLDDVAGRGGPLAGLGGTLDVVAGGLLAGRGGSLAALFTAAASAGFG
jgi:hypothetical protein